MTTRNEKNTQSILAVALAAASLCCVSVGALADDTASGEILKNSARLGGYFVHYDASAADISGPYTPPGINLKVNDVATVYFGYVRRLSDLWSVELTGGLPPKAKTIGKGPATVGSVPFNGQEVATAKWLSPSVLAEYSFFDEGSTWRPYVGLGVNYTKFYDRNSTPAGDAANGGPTSISLSRSLGPAATVGIAYKIDRNWNVYGSYSLARVNSNYVSNTSGIERKTNIHFNPSAFVVAVGYSF